MRILIAEDAPVSRRLLEAHLQKWGHQVTVTADGGEAWMALRADRAPRMAVIDWMMPGLDGLEVCRRVRLDPETRSVYVILLTARGRREDVIAGLEAGADDYVVKPFDPEDLLVLQEDPGRPELLAAGRVVRRATLRRAVQPLHLSRVLCEARRAGTPARDRPGRRPPRLNGPPPRRRSSPCRPPVAHPGDLVYPSAAWRRSIRSPSCPRRPAVAARRACAVARAVLPTPTCVISPGGSTGT